MEPAPAAEEVPPILWPVWATRLGLALLIGLALIAGLTWFDDSRRTKLETMSETTSVGDTVYFQIPEESHELPLTVAVLHGQPLVVARLDRLPLRDTHVVRVAHLAATGRAIYQLSVKAFPDERKLLEDEPKSYLLKVAPESYVRAHLANE